MSLTGMAGLIFAYYAKERWFKNHRRRFKSYLPLGHDVHWIEDCDGSFAYRLMILQS